MKNTITCALALGAVALAGCSSSGTHHATATSNAGQPVSTAHASGQGSSSAAKGPDACGLLADDALAQAVGATVVEHHTAPAGVADSACVWTLKSESGDIADPTVTIKTQADRQIGSNSDSFADATRGYSSVDNIGDKAAQGRNNQVGPQELVYVVDGVMYTISTQLTGDPVQDEKSNEGLALVVIANSFVSH